MTKVWFCEDHEQILSQIRDLCPVCNEEYCPDRDDYINEVTMHKQDGCKVVYIEEQWIKTTTLYIRSKDSISRPATVNDLEKAFLEIKLPPNFAYGLARVIPLTHKVVRGPDRSK